MSEQQAVVDEAKASAEPDAAVDSARKDDGIDELLSQFEQETAKPQPTTETKADSPPVPDRIKALEARLLQEDVDSVRGKVFEGLNVPRRAQIGWLIQMANEKPAIDKAFRNMHNDPQTWARLEKSLAKEAAADFKSDVDETVTADVMAAAAAVKGASKQVAADPPPNFGKMSAVDGRRKVMDEFGFDPGW